MDVRVKYMKTEGQLLFPPGAKGLTAGKTLLLSLDYSPKRHTHVVS